MTATTTTTSSTTTRATVEAYIEALTPTGQFATYLADDVTIEMVGTEIAARGHDDVAGFIRAAHFEMFDSTAEFTSVLVDEDRRAGACEVVFRARHIGEFAGIPATGREVEVPYSVHYEVADGHISAIRVYALAQGLVAALTA